jgi:carbonic anhydrase
MKKLVKGIVEFRRHELAKFKDTFARLANGQHPDTLFITCSDSRVAPNWFASTDPGDLFVVRNVGNLIPRCGADGHSTADESEAAAIEFAIMNLHIKDIIVCGHSDCGAMHAILGGREKVNSVTSNLKAWLRHAEPSLEKMPADRRAVVADKKANAETVNLLSQMNVLKQLENLYTYPLVRERVDAKHIQLHAWWFELGTGSIHAYEESLGKFVLIDEEEAARILAQLNS